MYKRQVLQPNGTYNVTYTITVNNLGGPGQYDLTDTPSFDDDISCLLYTSDAADERSSVDLGGRRIIKKKKRVEQDNIPRDT